MARLNHRISVIVIALIIIIFLSSASLSFAGNVTFIKEYTYQASELDSKASCRTISLEMVKRLLLEELGTYLIAETEVKDFKLTKEQIKTYSAGIVGAEIIEDKWDGKTYWLKAKVSADPKEVQKSLKKIIDDKYQAKQLEETREKAEELTKEVERLNKALAKATNKQPSQKVQQEYKNAIEGLTAIEWVNKGYEAGIAERPQEALEAFTKAIELKPDYAMAYYNRGTAYYNLGSYQQAIEDYDRAIALNPNLVYAYNNRGTAYINKEQYDRGLEDYSKAMALNPYAAITYYNRGIAYVNKGLYDRAIEDFNKAIALDSNDAAAYYNRGVAHDSKGQYDKAIEDYSKAIAINPNLAEAYNNRGVSYYKKGILNMAVSDFQKACNMGHENGCKGLQLFFKKR